MTTFYSALFYFILFNQHPATAAFSGGTILTVNNHLIYESLLMNTDTPMYILYRSAV